MYTAVRNVIKVVLFIKCFRIKHYNKSERRLIKLNLNFTNF